MPPAALESITEEVRRADLPTWARAAGLGIRLSVLGHGKTTAFGNQRQETSRRESERQDSASQDQLSLGAGPQPTVGAAVPRCPELTTSPACCQHHGDEPHAAACWVHAEPHPGLTASPLSCEPLPLRTFPLVATGRSPRTQNVHAASMLPEPHPGGLGWR